jgi:DNA-binding transcriptional LysR family regulator
MNFNALDLNLVRVFDALMTERSATRAGERIGLSQPAVSAALSRLRHALGDQLFIRRGNDMVPTPRAEELAALARSALSQIERMVEVPGPFDPGTLERQFTIMGSDFISMLLMPELSQRIRQAAPGVVLRLRDTSIGDVARQLREDSVDVAIEPAIATEEGVTSRPLFPSPFMLVARRGHAALAAAGIAPGAIIPLDLYCALPHALRSVDGGLTGAVDNALNKTGHRRRVMLTMPQFEAVALAVAAGDYLAALPVQFAEAVVKRLPLELYRLPVDVPAADIRVLWHARHDAERAHRWLRDTIAETVADLGWTG